MAEGREPGAPVERHNTVKTGLLSSLIVAALLVTASPVVALSCAEPEPFDMAAAVEVADGAAVGTVVSIIALNRTDHGDADLFLTVEIDRIFKGEFPRRVFVHREVSVWGPFYDVGHELALLNNEGVIDDGHNSLCGPFYSNELMEREAGEGRLVEHGPRSMRDRLAELIRLLELMVRVSA